MMDREMCFTQFPPGGMVITLPLSLIHFFTLYKPIGAAPWWHFFLGGEGACGMMLRSVGYGFLRKERNPPQANMHAYRTVYDMHIDDVQTGFAAPFFQKYKL